MVWYSSHLLTFDFLGIVMKVDLNQSIGMNVVKNLNQASSNSPPDLLMDSKIVMPLLD